MATVNYEEATSSRMAWLFSGVIFMTTIFSSPEFSPVELSTAVHQVLADWSKTNKPDKTSLLASLRLVQNEVRDGANPDVLRLAIKKVVLNGLEALSNQNSIGANILRARFLDNTIGEQVAIKMGFSRSQVNRQQRIALDDLAQIILALEMVARREQAKELAARLEIPTYTGGLLFGVEAIQAALLEQLLADAVPWVIVVTGIGGIGKTALTDSVTRQLIPHFRYEEIVWLRVNTATASTRLSPDLTFQDLMTRLAQRFYPSWQPQPGDNTAEQKVRRVLKGMRCLVVIDNLELERDVAYLLAQLSDLARPSKFLLTSRARPPASYGVRELRLTELTMPAAATLIRHHADAIGFPAMAQASDSDMQAIYRLAGGNPLALKLVVGLAVDFPLEVILKDLRQARMGVVEEMYRYIYWQSWQALTPDAQSLLEIMPLAADIGMEVEQMMAVSELDESIFWSALSQLLHRSLIEVRGTSWHKRYGLHQLTDSFLRTDIIKWPPDRSL
jgi:hypothetical protein